MPRVSLPSDKFCSLVVVDAEALQRPEAQSKYQQLWREFIPAGVSLYSRLKRNPWMQKVHDSHHLHA